MCYYHTESVPGTFRERSDILDVYSATTTVLSSYEVTLFGGDFDSDSTVIWTETARTQCFAFLTLSIFGDI